MAVTSHQSILIGFNTHLELKAWIQKEVQTSTKLCSKSNRINPEQMRNIIREELKKQQKNQLKPDFASASAGKLATPHNM